MRLCPVPMRLESVAIRFIKLLGRLKREALGRESWEGGSSQELVRGTGDGDLGVTCVAALIINVIGRPTALP